MESRTHYVLGFMFNPEKDRVLLVKKNRPEYQKGKFNGLGGKIESEETPLQAMIREFEEECGIVHAGWEKYCELGGSNWNIHIFRAFGDIDLAEDKTDEEVFTVDINNLPENVMSNVNWLIPMGVTTRPLYNRGTLI